jgi:hypothetical protein
MTVLLAVPMVNLLAMMALAYLDLGNVMYTIVIVLAVKMKLIVAVKKNV